MGAPFSRMDAPLPIGWATVVENNPIFYIRLLNRLTFFHCSPKFLNGKLRTQRCLVVPSN